MSDMLLYAAAAISVLSANQQGKNNIRAAEAEQAQLDAAAKSAEAESQYEADARRRKSELMISRALAVGGSSGAGTQGLDSLLRDIGAEGETAAGYALYGGKEAAEGMRFKGAYGVSSARANASATLMSSIGNAGLSLYSNYGGGGDGGGVFSKLDQKLVPKWSM